MAFLFCLIDFLVLGLMSLDTLSLLNQIRKKGQTDKQDYTRVIFTWIFVLTIRFLTCCSCTGLIANFFKLLGTVAKVYLALPILRGTNTVYDFLIEKKNGEKYMNKAIEIFKTYAMPPAPAVEEKKADSDKQVPSEEGQKAAE